VSKNKTEQAASGRAEPYARILDLTEAGLWIALLVVGSLVALAVLRDSETRYRPPATAMPAPDGLIEAEDFRELGKRRDFSFWLQPTSGFTSGNWSADGHMFANNTMEGDWVDLAFPKYESGLYTAELFATKAGDYGIIEILLNGKSLGEFDLWSGRGVLPTGALVLGELELTDEENVLRIKVAGKNEHSIAPYYQFGIDGIRIEKFAPAPATDEAGESQ
jgi:hypothetical protein